MILADLARFAHEAAASIIPAAGSAGQPVPTPSVGPEPTIVNTDGIVAFLATKVAPILLAVLGVMFMSRAGKGEMSRVLTSSAIAIIGLAFIAGATALFFFGKSLVDLIFGTSP